MNKFASAAITCVLVSACNQGQQGYQQQGYNQGASQQQGYDPNQQAQQQVAPAPVPTVTQTVAAASHAHADWAGKWIGVEGMYISITPSAPGNYDIEMQPDLDRVLRVNGIDSGNAISFVRDGQTFTLRPSKGGQIGLKWLDGKQNCLMVQDGEGYCR